MKKGLDNRIVNLPKELVKTSKNRIRIGYESKIVREGETRVPLIEDMYNQNYLDNMVFIFEDEKRFKKSRIRPKEMLAMVMKLIKEEINNQREKIKRETAMKRNELQKKV